MSRENEALESPSRASFLRGFRGPDRVELFTQCEVAITPANRYGHTLCHHRAGFSPKLPGDSSRRGASPPGPHRGPRRGLPPGGGGQDLVPDPARVVSGGPVRGKPAWLEESETCFLPAAGRQANRERSRERPPREAGPFPESHPFEQLIGKHSFREPSSRDAGRGASRATTLGDESPFLGELATPNQGAPRRDEPSGRLLRAPSPGGSGGSR